MGIIQGEDRKPGRRVRHLRELWTGTITEIMADKFVGRVQPDGGGRDRWMDLDEFEPWPDVPPSEAIRRRYLTDPVFHQLVHYQRQLLQMARHLRVDKAEAAQDLKDAVDLAVQMEVEIAARRAAFDGAAGDDVRGRIQDAQEKRGEDKAAEPEPGW